MRKFALLALAAVGAMSQAAYAQDMVSTNGTSFRGLRLEGNAGGDRFTALGHSHNKFGYGGTIGFDGQIGDRIVIGPEGTFWRANDWNQDCAANAGGATCLKSFEEWGVGVRAGFLLTPQLLVFGKGGYVSNEQRASFAASTPTGIGSTYDHYRTDGYQVGGGVEYTLTQVSFPVPLFVSAQYVYSQYNDRTSRQRVMGGIGIRFK